MNFANLAYECNVKYYGLLTSVGASSSSWFLYPRTKGRVEEAVSAVKIPIVTIFRPGLLLNRDKPRFVEKLFSKIPIGPRI